MLKPEFAALLQNNDPPSESTILEVAESLKRPVNELQEVEAEIQRLGELLETMKTKRQRIQKVISDHNIILSPARRLPPDVLHEIFFHCLPTYHNSVMKCSESPLLLTRICSSWRAIAMSSPRLWSRIHIPLPGDPSLAELGLEIITDETRLDHRRRRFAGIMRSRCDAVRTWLSRSGTCPLSLSVDHYAYHSRVENSKDNELLQEMLGILRSFAHRWSDVNVSMPDVIYDNLQGDTNPSTFSSLTSLNLALWDHSAELSPIRLLAAPGLRRITINSINTTLHMTESLAQLNWNHITHITFVSWTTDKYFFVLLRQCPNLVFGHFQIDRSPYNLPDQTVADQEEIFLPRLESLAITDSGTYDIMSIIFHAIKAPSLTRLLYKWLNQYGTAIMPTPVIPLVKNSNLITDLSLDGGLSPEDTEECLQHGARVTRVVFGKPLPPSRTVNSDMVPNDRFDLKLLSVHSGNVILLPKLEFLEAYHIASFTDEDLLDLITSRIHAFKRGETAALRFVKIHFKRYRLNDITEDVSRLAKDAGIEVKLDLDYLLDSPKLLDRLSASYGLAQHERTCLQFAFLVLEEFICLAAALDLFWRIEE